MSTQHLVDFKSSYLGILDGLSILGTIPLSHYEDETEIFSQSEEQEGKEKKVIRTSKTIHRNKRMSGYDKMQQAEYVAIISQMEKLLKRAGEIVERNVGKWD